MKAAEFFLERMSAAQAEPDRLKLIRDIQCDVLNSIGQFAMEEHEFVFAARIGTVAAAIENFGGRPTPTSPVVPDSIRKITMSEQEKTPPWKSFLYAIAGAYVVSCSIIVHDNPDLGGSASVVMAIWGTCFWAGGIWNLFVDRRAHRAAQKAD